MIDYCCNYPQNSLLVFPRIDIDHVGVAHHHGVTVAVAELSVTQSYILVTGSNDGTEKRINPANDMTEMRRDGWVHRRRTARGRIRQRSRADRER